MPSLAQYTANQANAQLSTGPRTAEGKARVAQNARTHGFTGQSLLVADEDKPAFEALRAGLIEDTRPEGALEAEIFRRLLSHAWNLRRIESFEARVLAETDPLASSEAEQLKLERWARYRRDVERGFYRALNELRKLQTQRAALLQQDSHVVAAFYENAPLAEITRLTKQTDSFFRQPASPTPTPVVRTYPKPANSQPEGPAPGI